MTTARVVTLPTVLVIDPSPELCDLLQAFLTSEGYQVVVAATLAQAQAVLTHQRPDLVLSEVLLPDAAPFAVRELLAAAAATRALPLVLCTGAVAEVEADAAGLAQAGVAVLLKPFDLDDLLATVAGRVGMPRHAVVDCLPHPFPAFPFPAFPAQPEDPPWRTLRSRCAAGPAEAGRDTAHDRGGADGYGRGRGATGGDGAGSRRDRSSLLVCSDRSATC